MIVAGLTYWINNFGLFLGLPIPYIQWVTLIAELSLALWLLVVGVNEAKWRAQLAQPNRRPPCAVACVLCTWSAGSNGLRAEGHSFDQIGWYRPDLRFK
jgi:hypothetical protein